MNRYDPPDEPAVFNLRETLDRFGGDEDLFCEIAALYLEDSPALLNAVVEALSLGDATRVRAAAHQLKGMAASFGADAAVESGQKAETAAAVGDLSAVRDEVPRLLAAFRRLSSSIEETIHNCSLAPKSRRINSRKMA